MKKWISLLLCLVMTLSLIPAAFAEEAQDEPALTEPAEEIEAEEPAEEPAEEIEAKEPAEEPEEGIESVTEPVDDDADAVLNPIDEDIEATVYVNSKNFPDANFRNWVKTNISGGESSMTQAQADDVVKIDCSNENIANLTGIALFKNLKVLVCNGNKLTKLDLRKNTHLWRLECKNNSLTSLLVSGCPDLDFLACTGNKLKALDLSKNKKLKSLYASSNNFSTLNLSALTSLEHVHLNDNSLTKLDTLKNNKNLVELSATNNKISSVVLTNFTKLETLKLSGNKLTKIDLSKNTVLKTLDLGSNSLDEKLDLTKNTALEELNIAKNSIKEIDLSKNTALKKLTANSTGLEKVDLTKNTALEELVINSNKLTTLDVTKNTKLTLLKADSNTLTTIDVSKNTDLVTLSLKSCGLVALDLYYNTKLVNLYVNSNKLPSLDVSANTKLVNLNCASNNLKDLDVSACSSLDALTCNSNKIVALNIMGCSKLRTLNCQNNHIDELDPTSCTNLETLNCSNNNLRALHLSSNPILGSINFANQTTVDPMNLTIVSDEYVFDMSTFFTNPSDIAYVKAASSVCSYDKSTGKMTMPKLLSSLSGFKYLFETGKGDMTVEVNRSFNAEYSVKFASGEVKYIGSTPYVVYTGYEMCPKFVVTDAKGNTIDESYYSYSYTDNVDPGTGYLYVTMHGHTETTELWYKIYLPGSEELKVENVSDGIQLNWKAVPGAGGYVIYRRAWSSTTNGWTSFSRWNYTTSTSWKDTKVYACSKYEYGVKAYFTDPFDNYNLGLVSPKIITVRITTRTLASVTPGASKITAKWDASKKFTGYELQVATDTAFKENVKSIKVTDWETAKGTISNLKANTTYYVRVRSYHEFEKKDYYGEWSNVLSCKTN